MMLCNITLVYQTHPLRWILDSTFCPPIYSLQLDQSLEYIALFILHRIMSFIIWTDISCSSLPHHIGYGWSHKTILTMARAGHGC